jgi:hypothetical protein
VSDQDLQYGLKILGLGRDETLLAATIFGFRKWHRITPAPGGVELEDYTLEQMPESVNDAVDPIARTMQTSAYAFEMPWHTKVVEMLQWQEPIPFATLSAPATREGGTIPLWVEGHQDRVVFIGREAIKLGAYSPGVGYIGSVRGFWESKKSAYPVGAGVYLGPPQKKGRDVQLVVYDPVEHAYVPRWHGVLTAMATDDTCTTLTLQCSSGFEALGQMPMARAMGTLTARAHIKLTRIGATGALYASGFIDMTGALPGVKKTISTQYSIVALQIGQGLFLGKYTPGKDEIRLGNLKELAGGVALLGSGPQMLETGGVIEDVSSAGLEVREVYLISRELDARTGQPVSASSALASSARALYNPYNRAAVMYALLTSTSLQGLISFDAERFDVHTPVWSRDVSYLLDHASWAEAIEACQDALPLEQILLGWDGEVPSVFDTFEMVMGPAGQFMAVTEANRLSVKGFAALDVRTFCAAQAQGLRIISPAQGGTLKIEDAYTQAVEEVRAQVGGLPWEAPSEIIVKLGAAGDYEGSEKLEVASPYAIELDLRTIPKSALITRGDGDAGDLLSAQLRAQGALAYLSLPRLSVVAPDSKTLDLDPYDIGSFVTLAQGLPEDPRLPVPVPGARPKLITNPSLEDLDTRVRFTGMLIARGFGIKNLTCALEMLLISWNTALLARLRAPSMRIEAAVETGGFWQLTGGALYGLDDPDAQSFKVGDEIEIWEPWGVRWSGNVLATVAHIVGDTLYVKSPAYGETMTNVSWKRVVRLARSDTYANTAHVECFERAHAYYANDADQIREPGGAVKGDPHG